MKKVIIVTSLLITYFISISCSTEASEASEASELTIKNIASLKSLKTIEIEILELINEFRLTKNLPVLLQNEQIRTQTYDHTNYMIRNNTPSHDNFYKRKNYLTSYVGATSVSENVAYGYSSAQSVVNAWLNSDSHRLNIESEHTHFNVTAEKDKNDKWYFTNIFIQIINE